MINNSNIIHIYNWCVCPRDSLATWLYYCLEYIEVYYTYILLYCIYAERKSDVCSVVMFSNHTDTPISAVMILFSKSFEISYMIEFTLIINMPHYNNQFTYYTCYYGIITECMNYVLQFTIIAYSVGVYIINPKHNTYL
jgi:hypothetical protein